MDFRALLLHHLIQQFLTDVVRGAGVLGTVKSYAQISLQAPAE